MQILTNAVEFGGITHVSKHWQLAAKGVQIAPSCRAFSSRDVALTSNVVACLLLEYLRCETLSHPLYSGVV